VGQLKISLAAPISRKGSELTDGGELVGDEPVLLARREEVPFRGRRTSSKRLVLALRKHLGQCPCWGILGSAVADLSRFRFYGRAWRAANEVNVGARSKPLELGQEPPRARRIDGRGGNNMDTSTLLIIVILLLVLGGGGWYGRGRWF